MYLSTQDRINLAIKNAKEQGYTHLIVIRHLRDNENYFISVTHKQDVAQVEQEHLNKGGRDIVKTYFLLD